MAKKMVNTKFVPKKVDYKKIRVSKHVMPNQSMTMKEVIDRFVRGLSLDLKQKPKIYLEQNDYDFEKMSGMEPTEKAYQATEFKAQAEALSEEVKANDVARKERKKKADIDEAVAKAKKEPAPKTESPKGGEEA